MQITLLGTGTSQGVPLIGCTCKVCTSDDPRDRRTRTSCLVEVDGINILIDPGPDFRHQALRENIRYIDAVLLTHHHIDHAGGMDDLRPFFFRNRNRMPCYGNRWTRKYVRQMYPWIFGTSPFHSGPRLDLHSVRKPFWVESRYGKNGSVRVEAVEIKHGKMDVNGFRIGRFAYLTDVSRIPEHTFAKLRNLDVLVVDALHDRPHPRHFTINEAVEASLRIGARKTFFVHMTHRVSHKEDDARLPHGISLGYDGLSVEIQEKK